MLLVPHNQQYSMAPPAFDVSVGVRYEGQLLQQLLADVFTHTKDTVSHLPSEATNSSTDTAVGHTT